MLTALFLSLSLLYLFLSFASLNFLCLIKQIKMPPKRDQLNNTVPPHHTVQSMSFSCLPVEDMFAQYDANRGIQDDLLLKEQQDMVRYCSI